MPDGTQTGKSWVAFDGDFDVVGRNKNATSKHKFVLEENDDDLAGSWCHILQSLPRKSTYTEHLNAYVTSSVPIFGVFVRSENTRVLENPLKLG